MSGLRVELARVVLGGRTIVREAGFTAPTGAVTGLIGPNGAGKSTLIGAMLGLVPLAAGRVTFEGADLAGMGRRDRARLAAYVAQSATTEDRVSVRDVVGLGRIPFQSAWQADTDEGDAAIVAAALAEAGMSGFADRLYPTLSGGEQQRVQLARALAQTPRLLVLDEPTSHLDIRAQLLVLELLRRRAAGGCTVVLALHDLNLALNHCDHVAVMKDGAVVAEGAPASILTPALLLAVYGVHARVLPGAGGAAPVIPFARPAAEAGPQYPD